MFSKVLMTSPAFLVISAVCGETEGREMKYSKDASTEALSPINAN